MQNKSIYGQIISSKTGLNIPVFLSGRTVESRYDPERDCERKLEQINANTGFFIVLGIAGGILIQKLLKKNPKAFILAVEVEQQDINFLQQLKLIQELEKNKRVCFCTVNQLEQKILSLYVPSFYGNLELIEQNGWCNENTAITNELKNIIKNALALVSADFSVQCHFGKIWAHNIMSNLKFIKNINLNLESRILEKTAVIFAAGPTVDQTIKQVLQNREYYYVISTDTAFSILYSAAIIPDAVISLDGQNVSSSHFIHDACSTPLDFSHTSFIFDLCANPGAVKKAYKTNSKLFFFSSGHPFTSFIKNQFKINLPFFTSGSGTVTIAAVNFSIKAGFKNIKVFGADFSYVNGKAYASGTYLDRLYGKNSSKTISLEKQFDSLMFRTPLILQNDKSLTTTVLNSYKTSFENYLKEEGVQFIKQDNCYTIKSEKSPELLENQIPKDFEPEQIVKDICSDSCKAPDFLTELSIKDISLLPLISWIRYNDNNKEADFNYFYNRAQEYYKKYL